MSQEFRQQTGFTILEVVVVVALAILLAGLIVVFANQ